jgi:DNA-binding MarR family transcriptional regulator
VPAIRPTLQEELGKANPFDSPEQEAFLNLLRTQAHLSAGFFKRFKAHGLSEATYNVLRILRGVHQRGDRHGLRSTEIGKDMVVRVPDVTRLVDRLIEKGLAERGRCDEDRRVVYVKITRAGLTMLKKMDQPLRELHKQQLGHLSGKELSDLCRLLTKARQPEA